MTDAINLTLDDAVQQLRAALPNVDVERHAGRFGLQELKRLAVRTPAIRLSMLAIPPGQREKDGSIQTEAQWAAFVVTSDRGGRKRDEEALRLVEQLYLWLPWKKWGAAQPLNPSTLDARNLYGADLDTQTACAIWAITWRQTITLKGASNT